MGCKKKYQFQQNNVSLGGGGGQHIYLRGVVKLNQPELNTAVTGNWDSGGISGEQRVKEGILPPGDYMKCMLGLMEDEEQYQETMFLLQDRSEGTPITHLMASRAEKLHHGVENGIDGLRKSYRITGKILLSTLFDTQLHFETKNGVHFDQEHKLDDLDDDPKFSLMDEVSKIYLVPNPLVNPKVKDALSKADKIVFPPASPFGSTFPHLLIDGISEAILDSQGILVLVLNLMTTRGQDHHLDKASRWLSVFQYYLGDQEWIKNYGRSRIDYLVVNDNHIDPDVVSFYQSKGQKLVEVDENNCLKQAPGLQIIREKLVEYMPKSHIIRHNPEKLARTVLLLKKKQRKSPIAGAKSRKT